MSNQQRVSIRGRASRSHVMGKDDPRSRRGAQSETRGENYAPPLYIDKYGRLAIDLVLLKAELAKLP